MKEFVIYEGINSLQLFMKEFVIYEGINSLQLFMKEFVIMKESIVYSCL